MIIVEIFMILGYITNGFDNNSCNMSRLLQDYEQLGEEVGTMDYFHLRLKQYHEKSMKVILSSDFNSISINHMWFVVNKIKMTVFEDHFHNEVTMSNIFFS